MKSNKIPSGPFLKEKIFSPAIYLTLRSALGGIFILSGSLKLMDTDNFARILYEYGILIDPLIIPASIGIPILEIIAGLGLIFNIKYCLELITAMLLVFIGVLWFGILKNLNIDCGCFSSEEISEHGNLHESLYRDFVFIAISIFLFSCRIINNANKPHHLFIHRK